MRTDTRPATRCCGASPDCSAGRCATWTSSPATAARSSWSCFRERAWTTPPRRPCAACEAIAKSPFRHEEKELRVTVSFGVAEALGDEDGATLVARADKALYAAKEGGRNCVCRHDGKTVARVAGAKELAASKSNGQPQSGPAPCEGERTKKAGPTPRRRRGTEALDFTRPGVGRDFRFALPQHLLPTGPKPHGGVEAGRADVLRRPGRGGPVRAGRRPSRPAERARSPRKRRPGTLPQPCAKWTSSASTPPAASPSCCPRRDLPTRSAWRSACEKDSPSTLAPRKASIRGLRSASASCRSRKKTIPSPCSRAPKPPWTSRTAAEAIGRIITTASAARPITAMLETMDYLA